MENVCPYIERMGICLEPAACFLKHKTMDAAASEYVYQSAPQEQSEDKKLMDAKYNDNSMFGMDGNIYCEERKDCPCCGGLFTNCQGEACEHLGMCFCMLAEEGDVMAQMASMSQEESKQA